MPTPTRTCATASTAKSDASALTSEPNARITSAPSMMPRSPTRAARNPVASAAAPAASPETVRSCPAVATETWRSRATSGRSGLRTASAACDAASAERSVMPTARGPSASENDRNRAAVGAPGRAGDVRRALGAEEDDDRGDLLRSRQAPQRTSGADLRENVIPVSLLVSETSLAEPCVRLGRSGRHRVATDPVLRVQVGDEARKREHRSLVTE